MKTKNQKKLVAIGLFISMFVLYGLLPLPQGAKAIDALKDASDTLSDSDMDSTGVVHTIEFTTTTDIPAGGRIEVTFDPEFPANIPADGDINCGGGTASGGGTLTAVCTYAAGILPDTTQTIVVSNMTNPATDGDRSVHVKTYDGTELLDQVELLVYIISDVWMTAHVDPILEFTLTGVEADSKQVNSINCDETTYSTTTPFGTLVVNATTTVCQQLNVTTNADDGYIVTVEQDMELTSDSGSTINSFNNSPDNTGSTTPQTWVAPTNTLDAYHTYGHMGLTSDDADLDAFLYNDYYNGGGTAQYVGLNSTDPVVVMHHDGPSDGTTQNVGVAFVAYSAQIASLQEAGDYENTLTYIATPTY